MIYRGIQPYSVLHKWLGPHYWDCKHVIDDFGNEIEIVLKKHDVVWHFLSQSYR